MTLTTVAVLTIFAALINGFAVAGTLRFLWNVDGDSMRPSYAAIPGNRLHHSGLSGVTRGQDWVDLTTLDTPILRIAAPPRPSATAHSTIERDYAVDETTNLLLRQLREA